MMLLQNMVEEAAHRESTCRTTLYTNQVLERSDKELPVQTADTICAHPNPQPPAKPQPENLLGALRFKSFQHLSTSSSETEAQRPKPPKPSTLNLA